MKRKFLLLALSAFAFTSVKAQFQRSYGTPNRELSRSVRITADTGYINAGETSLVTFGSIDATLFKTTKTGALQWTKAYGGPGVDRFNSVREVITTAVPNIRYAAVGSSTSYSPSEDAYLVGTDPVGNALFSRIFGGPGTDRFHCIQLINHPVDGPGYVMVGETNSFTQLGGGFDIYVVRTSLTGTLLAARIIGGPGTQRGYWIEQTADRGFIIAGSNTRNCVTHSTLNEDIFAVKLDANFNLLWNRIIGSSTTAGADVSFCVKEDPNTNLVFTGYTRSFSTSQDLFLMKLSSAGVPIWFRTYGGVRTEVGQTLLVDRNINGVSYVVSGTSNSFSTNAVSDVIALKTDINGNTIWARKYGITNSENGNEITFSALRVDLTRGYAIAGMTTSFGAGSADSYLIETTNSGNSGTNCQATVSMPPVTRTPCVGSEARILAVSPVTIVPNSSKAIAYSTRSCLILSPADEALKEAADVADMTESELNVSPNPASTEIVLSAGASCEGGKLRILNARGEIVKESDIQQGDLTLPVEHLAEGIYFITIFRKDGSVINRKFVKN